jgi:hypothetical protein
MTYFQDIPERFRKIPICPQGDKAEGEDLPDTGTGTGSEVLWWTVAERVYRHKF